MCLYFDIFGRRRSDADHWKLLARDYPETLLRLSRRIGHPVDEAMARSMKQYSESDTTVELWSARIPGFGRFAEHHWLVVWRGSSTARWEVWQTPDECATSWGHLHCNLLRPSSGVGNGPGRLIHHWDSDDALYLAARIESTPATYPWRHRYRVFPGPNSNTYVQWVLGPLYTLGWRGFGRRFAHPKITSPIMPRLDAEQLPSGWDSSFNLGR